MSAQRCSTAGSSRFGLAARSGALALALVGGLGLAGCARPAPASAPGPAGQGEPRGPARSFSFVTLEGEAVDSATTRGRATAVLFVTTYDLASQVVAARLSTVLRVHTPRANGLLVVLESAAYSGLAAAFRDSLELRLPVAMADADTLAGVGPFGAVRRVPTLVVLDREGREVARQPGVVTHAEIEKALATASERGN